jgi:glutathione S-transferase
MSRYISITAARSAPGLRLACLRGVPSPWTEAAKGVFHVKGLACQYAAQAKDEPDGALAAWAGNVGIPVVAYDGEKLRTGWAEILLLAERLKPEPALIPSGAADARTAKSRVLEILQMLSERISGRRYLLGASLTALDIYWATFSNLMIPLPENALPALPTFRAAYTCNDDDILKAIYDGLRALRQRVYETHLELPVLL